MYKGKKVGDCVLDFVELYTGYCSECRGSAFIGRVCTNCGGQDTAYHTGIRSTVAALSDVGFKLSRVWSKVIRRKSGEDIWGVTIEFEREYPVEIFMQLWHRFILEVKAGETVQRIVYDSRRPLTDFTDVSDTEVEQFVASVLDEVNFYVWRWLEQVNASGHTAVWKLGGYFD